MRLRFVTVVLYIFVLLLLIACASEPDDDPFKRLGIDKNQAQTAPEFISSPPYADLTLIYGVGKGNLPTVEESRRQAVGQAHEDIMIQVRLLVTSAINDYAMATSVAKTPVLIDFSERVINAVLVSIQQSSRIEEISASKDGTIYCLVSVATETFMDIFQDTLEKNKQYAFASFRTSQAIEYAQSIISAAPPQAGSAVKPL